MMTQLNVLLGLWVALELSLASVGAQTAIHLSDVTAQSGITFRHSDGSEGGHRYITESVASGLASFDYNGDGKIDLLFLNGLDPAASNPSAGLCALYRNDGNMQFSDVSDTAGLTGRAHHLGVCVGDYDNDGLPDIYLSNFGRDTLYRNLGNGRFADVTEQAGLGSTEAFGAGAAFLDMDGDGDLDLYVARYCEFTLSSHQTRHVNGFPAYTGPMTYGPSADQLFENLGNGSFKEVSESSGIQARKGTGMGVIAVDHDNDGDVDIVVGNDAMANFVWRNDGKGHFVEVGLLSGLAFDANGVGLGTMGVECADFNHDGLMDFFMTSYEKQWVTLYQGEAHGLFTDVTHLTQAGQGSYQEVTWGCGMVDFDNDGRRDLFIACGHLQDNVQRWDELAGWQARNLLLQQNKDARFQQQSNQSMSGLQPRRSSRGAIFEDLDNDGDMDVVILNARDHPTLLRNDSRNDHKWIGFELQTPSGRSAIGARVVFTCNSLTYMDEVHSGRGYQSHYATRLHFGLGKQEAISEVTVRWPTGQQETYRGLEVGQYHLLRQRR
jgi:hypothetical protein